MNTVASQEIEKSEWRVEPSAFYSEVSGPRDSNVIEQLNSNINLLEDLHRRMNFMVGEIKDLLVRPKI